MANLQSAARKDPRDTVSTPSMVTVAQLENLGRPFATVLVSRVAMDSDRREYLRLGLSVRLQADVVLASRDLDGALKFYGERKLVEGLVELGPHEFRWRRLALETGSHGHAP